MQILVLKLLSFIIKSYLLDAQLLSNKIDVTDSLPQFLTYSRYYI